MKKFNKILFATDLTEFSEYAFDYALTLAKEFNAKLLIVHVINQPLGLQDYYALQISFDTIMEEVKKGAEKMLDEFCDKKLSGYDNYEKFIVSGIPDIEILNKADTEKVDLIVVGTHSRAGVDRFLFGSTAEKVVRKAVCPVLTVRPPEIKA